MEEIRLEFYKVYEPGELQAPMIKEDALPLTQKMKSVPRYKDQLNFGERRYFCHDVIYDMNPCNGEYTLTVKFYRKVNAGDFDGSLG